MADLVELLREAEELRRSTHVAPPTASMPPWFRIEAKAGDPKTAEVWIYDRIGSDFFDEGVSAKSFVRQVNALKVDEIILHVNSPGGDFFEGVAIYNALKNHPAKVTAVVDGIAASAASFIVQAGDIRRMSRAAQLMIHDASGVVIGNADDMADFAGVLNRTSDSIAGIYADRGGGTVADWRTAMRAETWYSAAEAVEAGLADEAADEAPAEPPVRNSWDLAIFNYAGRGAAPAPVMPSITARTNTPAPEAEVPPARSPKEGAGMDPAKMREALGLKADASDDEVRVAFTASALGVQPAPPADPPQSPPPTNPPAPPLPPEGEPRTPQPQPKATNSDAVTLDPEQYRQLRQEAAHGAEAYRKLREMECDGILDAAIKAQKFPPSRREHYKLRWATDPDGTKQEIEALSSVPPVGGLGYAGVGDETEQDMLYKQVYPERFTAGRGV